MREGKARRRNVSLLLVVVCLRQPGSIGAISHAEIDADELFLRSEPLSGGRIMSLAPGEGGDASELGATRLGRVGRVIG